MAQNSHVPKFGSWDKDNIPYTAYFENARKEKAGMKMNPNDPEENPEAFVYGRMDMENNDADFRVAQTPLHHSANKATGQRRNYPSDRQNSLSMRSITSESSDKSSRDYSLMQPGHRRQKSDRKKGFAAERSNSTSSSAMWRNSPRQTDHNSQHHRAASIPKFGAWDETDPKSGEGFTILFNRVKEERQIASTTFPSVPQLPRSFAEGQKNQPSSSSGSKFCCCVFWRASD